MHLLLAQRSGSGIGRLEGGGEVTAGVLLFACADANYRVNHLEWSEWHKKKAVADGVFHMNDCTPSCAEGTFHRRAGTLILKGRMWCSNIHEHVFRRAHYEYVMPFQGDSEGGFELSCPF